MKIALFLLVALTLTVTVVAPASFGQTRQQQKRNPRGKSKTPVKTGKYIKTVKPPVAVYQDDAPPPPPPPKYPVGKDVPISDVFENVTIGKWGVASLSVPANLKAEPETERIEQNGDVSWTVYSRTWKLPPPTRSLYAESAYEVDISVTTWNRDFTFVQDLRADLATPENMLKLDLMGEEKNKNTPGSLVRETYEMEAAGVRGGFFRAEYPSGGRGFLAGWYAYRYFEGKGQRISLTVTSREKEAERTMKIISSLALQ